MNTTIIPNILIFIPILSVVWGLIPSTVFGQKAKYRTDTTQFVLSTGIDWDLKAPLVCGYQDTFVVYLQDAGKLQFFKEKLLFKEIDFPAIYSRISAIKYGNKKIYLVTNDARLDIFDWDGKCMGVHLQESEPYISPYYYRYGGYEGNPAFEVWGNYWLSAIRPAWKQGEEYTQLSKPFFLKSEFYNPNHPIIRAIDLSKYDSTYTLYGYTYYVHKNPYLYIGKQDSFYTQNKYSYKHAYLHYCNAKNELWISQRAIPTIEKINMKQIENTNRTIISTFGIKGDSITAQDSLLVFPAKIVDSFADTHFVLSKMDIKLDRQIESKSYGYADMVALEDMDLLLRYYSKGMKINSLGVKENKRFMQFYSISKEKKILEIPLFKYTKTVSNTQDCVYFFKQLNFTTNSFEMIKMRIRE